MDQQIIKNDEFNCHLTSLQDSLISSVSFNNNAFV